jgi:hypothetical protein
MVDFRLDVSSELKLLVPSHYGATLKVRGSLGVRPDTEIVESTQRCERIGLPRSLGRMTFTFRRASHPLPAYDKREIVQNFYHQGEYFVVTSSILDFLRDNVPSDLDIMEVDVRHDDGRAASDRYFAVKVVRMIDCIDASASLANIGYLNPQVVPFDQAMVSFDLDESAAAEFANVEGRKYVSYPHWRSVKKLALTERGIPRDAVLFQPELWPNHMLVTSFFAEGLGRRCTGGTPAYYFWTLGLANPSESHSRLCHDLR